MKCLVVDSSTDQALVALSDHGIPVVEILLPGGKKLSPSLFPAVKTLFEQAGWKMKDISAIAIGTGPGSYMGVRSAATLGKTLSYALSIPMLSFLSPLAFIPEDCSGSFAYVGDAKMGELFLITGQIEDGLPINLSSTSLISPDELPQIIKEIPWVIEGQKDLRCNIPFISHYIYHLWLEGKLLTPQELTLTYIR